ncbi:MAG: HAMP domain-containing sensor histidine kinase, partial [Planctomycetota bacterium]
ETIYSEILEAPTSLMANLAWPTPEQISLARAETLSVLNRGKAVPGVLSKGLSFLDSAPRKTGSYRREAYLQGSLRILRETGLEVPRELKDARKEIELLKPIAKAVKHVRDVSLPRELSGKNNRSFSTARWSLRGYRDNVAIAWKPAASTLDSNRIKARGVVVNLTRMRQHLNQELANSADSGSLRVLMPTSANEEEMIPFASLGIEFPYISIGQPKAEWEEHLGAARRPFAIAGLLSGVLGLTLVGGLLILRRALRRELKLARMKTEFVANVSHELKTPLSLIKLCSETLQLDRLKGEEKRQEYFEVINRESDRLGHLIDNVLNFSKIDAGKKNYELKRADLAPLLNQTLDAYLLQLQEQDFTCRRDIPSSLPVVMADKEAVAQAFINLLQNAVRYSPDKGEISVRGSSNGKSLLLSVTDTGIGIAQEDQERIWDDYYRTAEARALGTRGSGLGLSLVSHIMAAHQGKTLLTSTPGAGSEFTLVFPLANEKEMEPENGR